jgi:hypothetical protein
LNFFKYPPNVFDNFTLASQVAAEERAAALSERLLASQVVADARADLLTSMIESRSWKITKPLRQSSMYARRLKGLIKFDLIKIAHMRPRVLVARMLRKLRAVIERKPGLKKFFLMILNKFPRLKLLLAGESTSRKRISPSQGATPEIYNSPRYKRIEHMVTHVLDGLGNQK